jgi:hypothetical protein
VHDGTTLVGYLRFAARRGLAWSSWRWRTVCSTATSIVAPRSEAPRPGCALLSTPWNACLASSIAHGLVEHRTETETDRHDSQGGKKPGRGPDTALANRPNAVISSASDLGSAS